MGRTAKPLTILLTDPVMLEWPEFTAMAAQGHRIVDMTDEWCPDADLVMGTKAHYLQSGMAKMIPMAIKSARALKFRKETNGQ